MRYTILLLILISNIFHVLSQSILNKTRSYITIPNRKFIITQLLVFSTNLETVIPFQSKQGWLIDEEKTLRLYMSGSDLGNRSIVFSSIYGQCRTNDYISPIYRLSSAPIIELNVQLPSASKTNSLIYICLLSPSVNQSYDQEQLEGPYFTFVRDKGLLPFPLKICLTLMLFIISGFFSGLNLGLMSISVNDLRLIAESKDSSMSHYAKRVLPLRKRGNFLLCSIVLANVLVNALGTVLLDSLVHGLFAVIGSTIMIVLMGEIIPQAICSRYGLIIGAHTHVIIWGCMVLTGAVSYPLGYILNKVLGQEVTASYTRDQIIGMLTRITADIEKPELDVITGVLSLRNKTVKDAMTLLPDVYMLDKDRKIDAELLLELHKHGFSRIPVYSNERSNVIGIVKLRDFAFITPEQYSLTVKHHLQFHSHSFGYTKITDSLYDLLQEFLKARWHIALVQEMNMIEDNVDPVHTIVGIITLEDVIEEMLQREIIEETDFFTDNRRKIQRKKAKTMDFTALIKRPIKGPAISPQLKIAVFQFLSTNVQQFSSAFISPEILKVLLNYNVYANVKRPASQSSHSIYLYKKSFRYELFTLIIQGNATLESGTERIMSTVGPFSYFATSALLAEDKTVKDVHRFLDQLAAKTTKFDDIPNLLDSISSIFVPDYNLIVNSELHILQIHRLVWLAAVRATQRQRSQNQIFKRMQSEQLLSITLDEISSLTNTTIDKTNLTNFQRIFLNEKVTKQTKENLNQTSVHNKSSSERVQELSNAVIYNPLLLNLSKSVQSNEKDDNSSNSTNFNEQVFNSNMHINRMFEDTHEQTTNNDSEPEKEHFIDQGYRIEKIQRKAVSSSNLINLRSNAYAPMQPSSHGQSEEIRENDQTSVERPRRARSMLNETKCAPS